jgi:pyruvyltransferase
MKAYWWRDGDNPQNWGDAFSEFLFRKYYNIQLEWSMPETSELICSGSIIDMVPNDYQGHVLGSGMLFGEHTKRLSRAHVHLLRGVHTRERCVYPHIVPIGDPGLLAYLFSKGSYKKYQYGIVPHKSDQGDTQLSSWNRSDTLIIDIGAGIQEVIDMVEQCEKVVSSTLHGLIMADSLGIPNHWVKLSSKLYGEDFKFKDYYSAFGEATIVTNDISEAFKRCRLRDVKNTKKTVKEVFDVFANSNSKK